MILYSDYREMNSVKIEENIEVPVKMGKLKEDIGNYRLIAVMNILAKTFGRIINNKMKWTD